MMRILGWATIGLLVLTALMYAVGGEVMPYCLIPLSLAAQTGFIWVRNRLIGHLPR